MAPERFEQSSSPSSAISRDSNGGDLGDFVMMLRRRSRLIIGVFSVVALLIVAYTLLQPRLYTASATIMINPRQERVLSQDQSMTEGAPSSALVDSELEVLRSRELAERLVVALKLEEKADWNPALQSQNPIVMALGAVRSLVSSRAEPTASGVNQNVVNHVAGAISVKRRALSYVIDISVTARSPHEAARIANKAVDVYLQMGYEARVETTHRASGWLDERLAALRTDVQAKESAAQQFRAEHGLLTSEGVTLTESQISSVQGSVLSARADLAEKEARYRQVEQMIARGGSADTMSDALNSQVIRDLRSREAELQRQKAEYQSTLGPMHPDVLRNQAELDDVRRQIQGETQRIRASLAGEVQVARARLGTLDGSLNSVQNNLADTDGSQVRLRELEREAAASRSVYESFLQRSHELSDQGRLETSDVRLVTSASPPESPSSPKLFLNFAIAVIAGLGAGIGLAVLIEALDDGIKSAAEAEQKLGVPAIASIPMVNEKALRLLDPSERHPSGFVAAKPMSGYAEAFRVLKTAIAYSNFDVKSRVIAITSAVPGEGKTTSSLSLARIAAMSGQKVLLIDCDLRRHSLNELLNIAPPKGLLQVLAGEASWQDVVARDDVSDAHILPTAASEFTPRDVFGSLAMRRLIEEVRAYYDLIILDCAPVLAVAETRVVAEQADGVIMIARWGKTPMRAVGDGLDQLESTGSKILGLAINAVDSRIPGRGSYGDSLYYSYGKSGYYSQ